MPSCGNCRFTAPLAPSPVLFQIRQAYRAQWNDLAFSVESGAGNWTLSILDGGRRMLYTAQRASVRAAQVAAAEFAIFRSGAESRLTPERLAGELNWQRQ